MKKDFSIITEHPKTMVTCEQLVRAYSRYKFAQQYCHGKIVLEIGSGGGQGLALLAEEAQKVIGSDVDDKNLEYLRTTYAGDSRIEIREINADKMDLPDDSVDVIVLFEVIYYIDNVIAFLKECRRILRDGGRLIIGSANVEWRDFNPSEYSVRYYTARDLCEILSANNFGVKLYIADKVFYDKRDLKSEIISLLKRVAIRWHLIPKSMKFKKYLKRIFVGSMVIMPDRIEDNMCDYLTHEEIDPYDYYKEFKVLYAVAEVGGEA